ncbi:unnamed protein product [Rotaria socialis]|uniref:Uncharacterized protein n=1 Tax=Rotaria socialis TaxID=392032 RepID=A0A818KSB4_9BILA|nr:unnamed protein product [Rotaria socialis]
MAANQVQVRLQKLLNNELSSHDKKLLISAYDALVSILQTPEMRKQLSEEHELLFECISKIILTSYNKYFHGDQLRFLLDLTSSVCTLSMSQNQIIDNWLQNIEERTFEKQDCYNDDDDDDNLIENGTESGKGGKKRSIQKNHRNSEPTKVHEASARGKNNRKSPRNDSTNNLSKGSSKSANKKRYTVPFNNKSNADRQFNHSYIGGEYGHVRTDSTNEKESPIEIILSKRSQSRFARICRKSRELIDVWYNVEKRNKKFKLNLSRIRKLQKLYGENLSTIFHEKESIFYSLVCHVAQNDFLFGNDQYLALYDLKNILLPEKYSLLNRDRSIFCRQRTLIPLNEITEHIQTKPVIQQTIFNDFQEYIIRSTSPILFDLIKYLLKSNIFINIEYLEYFSNRILFDMKKDIFSNEQLDELHRYCGNRMKRFECNNRELWTERSILFQNDKTIQNDLNQWILALDQVLSTNLIEQINDEKIVVQHSFWYSTILIMASSNHLNKDQFERVLKSGIQSTLFNSIQKFYLQYYLNEGHAPITINELNLIKTQLENQNINEKKLAYEQMKIILDRSKPEFKNEEFKQLDDLIPMIHHHVLHRLISLVELIFSHTNIFSKEQLQELLDKFLYQSTIVRPLPSKKTKKLLASYSRSISLRELETNCLSPKSDLRKCILLLRSRRFMEKDGAYDLLAESIINIFKNRQKFSNEPCQELKNLLDEKFLGKERYYLINEAYKEFRTNKNNLLIFNRTILNQLLNKILLKDYQAHLDFINVLENISQSIDFKEISVEFEINRCLLTAIILIIIDADYSNSSDLLLCQQRLTTIIEKQIIFFPLLLSEQQYELITSPSTVTADIDLLISLLKTTLNESDLLIINRTLLNQLLNKILLKDYQAHLDFINVLENISQSINFKEITIEFEIKRCLLTTIILIIIDADYSVSSELILFQQRLTTMIEKQRILFSLLLSEQQYELITSPSTVTSNIGVLISLLKTDLNESNFSNLIYFIQNRLKQKPDFRKLINFLIYSFDNEFLSIRQTLQISNLIFRYSKLNNNNSEHFLQFLIELLQLEIHSSPKFFLKLIRCDQENDEIISQITIMLTMQTGTYATVEWKRSMLSLLQIIFDRSDNYEDLKDIALRSSMFQKVIFRQQLESYAKKTSDNQSDENKEPVAVPKNNNNNDTPTKHCELFRRLESDDESINALAISQLRTYLVNEQLSSEILLPTFVQALQFIFHNFRKFPRVSLSKWILLIAKNRGKIFSSGALCDQLLIDIVLGRFHMPTNIFTSLNRLIQSNKTDQRHDGLSKLRLLLRITRINCKENEAHNLPTISNQLYNAITHIVFDGKFNDHQVQLCVKAARNSWLLNSDHREKLNNI